MAEAQARAPAAGDAHPRADADLGAGEDPPRELEGAAQPALGEQPAEALGGVGERRAPGQQRVCLGAGQAEGPRALRVLEQGGLDEPGLAEKERGPAEEVEAQHAAVGRRALVELVAELREAPALAEDGEDAAEALQPRAVLAHASAGPGVLGLLEPAELAYLLRGAGVHVARVVANRVLGKFRCRILVNRSM